MLMVSLVPISAIALVFVGTYYAAADMVLNSRLYDLSAVYEEYSYNSMISKQDGYLDGDLASLPPKQVVRAQSFDPVDLSVSESEEEDAFSAEFELSHLGFISMPASATQSDDEYDDPQEAPDQFEDLSDSLETDFFFPENS